MNYEKDIIIDETNIDVEVLNQAKLGLKYGIYFAECQDRLTRAEENLKLLKAQLTNELLEDPEDLIGVAKPTGPMMEAYYRDHKKHKEAKEEWIEASKELEIARVAQKEVCYTRKTMLELLVKLHAQSYFAGPSVPRDLSLENARVKEQKKSDSKVAKKLKKK